MTQDHMMLTVERKDVRVKQIAREFQQMLAPQMGIVGSLQNTYSTLHLFETDPNRQPHVLVGRVVQAIPTVHWYKVQVAGLNSNLACTALSPSGLLPVGVKPIQVIAPGSWVWLVRHPTEQLGYIMGVIPERLTDARLSLPDWVSQGSGTGFHRESVHHGVMRQLGLNGGVQHFGGGRPIDSTTLDWGYIAETGVGVFIDPFQAYLRVDESCGLFLNYFDHYARLAAWNLDLQTSVHEVSARNDEGELSLFTGVGVYAWEVMGFADLGQTLGEEQSDDDVQYGKPLAKLDLTEPVEPIYRCQTWGGYLGQGGLRQVMLPKDRVAVFEEAVGLNGEYSVRSARGISLVKTVARPLPARQKAPEASDGDDREKDNYPFAGIGDGSPHKVEDMQLTAAADEKNLQASLGLGDLQAHQSNWKNLHPFHYHGNDFEVPEAQAVGPVRQTPLDFSALENSQQLELGEPLSYEVDHRANVDVYQGEAGVYISPTGDVEIRNACGAALRLIGTEAFLEAPGNVWVRCGRKVQLWAGDDAIIKARNSVDVSATEKDVRIKSQANTQIVAGVGGKGALLLESQATEKVHKYDEKIGEDVESSGVILRATRSQIVGWGDGIYLRTLGDEGISLDARQGTAPIQLYGQTVEVFAAAEINHYFGPQGEDRPVTAANQFTGSATLIGSSVTVTGGGVFSGGSGLSIDGPISQINGSVSNQSGGEIGRLTGSSLNLTRTILDRAGGQAQERIQQGQETFQSRKETYYEDEKVGNEDLIARASFSYRDDEKAEQYGASKFAVVESVWQQMVREGAATGGSAWAEKPVRYQNQELYPYPGKKNLITDETLIYYSSPVLYDGATQTPKDRGEAYENPQFAELSRTSLQSYLAIP